MTYSTIQKKNTYQNFIEDERTRAFAGEIPLGLRNLELSRVTDTQSQRLKKIGISIPVNSYRVNGIVSLQRKDKQEIDLALLENKIKENLRSNLDNQLSTIKKYLKEEEEINSSLEKCIKEKKDLYTLAGLIRDEREICRELGLVCFPTRLYESLEDNLSFLEKTAPLLGKLVLVFLKGK